MAMELSSSSRIFQADSDPNLYETLKPPSGGFILSINWI